jgi:hypothetical protein
MTPLTLQDVLAHQASVPWPELYQVEQDLLLSLWVTGEPGAETRMSVPKLCLEVAGMRDSKRRK